MNVKQAQRHKNMFSGIEGRFCLVRVHLLLRPYIQTSGFLTLHGNHVLPLSEHWHTQPAPSSPAHSLSGPSASRESTWKDALVSFSTGCSPRLWQVTALTSTQPRHAFWASLVLDLAPTRCGVWGEHPSLLVPQFLLWQTQSKS